MTAPIEIRLRVDCAPAHAFEVWTGRIDMWWPRGHSVSADPGLHVAIEPGVGGRIVERTPAGAEHVWGEVLVWDPPRRLAYLWHIYGTREEATEVDVVFTPDGDGTAVTLTHTGWERLSATRPDLRDRNEAAWSRVLPHFAEACTTTDRRGGS
jgi:uncharacterized protein YndB with AHSA1/START domain